jgi:hypothetical protein
MPDRHAMGTAGACLTSLLPGSFMIVDPGPCDPTGVNTGRLTAARLESEALVRRYEQAAARALAVRDQVRWCRSQRQLLRSSLFAGRPPRCVPVIEQAKGIVMAQQGCRPEEAFDLLHRASQRAHVRVHVLAAQVVEHLVSSKDGGNVTPISLGAIRCVR